MISRLGTFAWMCFARKRSLDVVRFETFAWEFSMRNSRLASFEWNLSPIYSAWDVSLGNFRLGISTWYFVDKVLSLWSFLLGSSALKLSIGNVGFGMFRLGTFA